LHDAGPITPCPCPRATCMSPEAGPWPNEQAQRAWGCCASAGTAGARPRVPGRCPSPSARRRCSRRRCPACRTRTPPATGADPTSLSALHAQHAAMRRCPGSSSLTSGQVRTGERTGRAGGRRPVSRQSLRAAYAVSTHDAHRHNSTRAPQAGCLPRRFKSAGHLHPGHALSLACCAPPSRPPNLAPLRACSSWSHECPASVAWLHSTLSLKSFSRPYARRKAIVVATSQSYWCLVGSWASAHAQRQVQGHWQLPGAEICRIARPCV